MGTPPPRSRLLSQQNRQKGIKVLQTRGSIPNKNAVRLCVRIGILRLSYTSKANAPRLREHTMFTLTENRHDRPLGTPAIGRVLAVSCPEVMEDSFRFMYAVVIIRPT